MENRKSFSRLSLLSNMVIAVCSITLFAVGARVSSNKHQHNDIQRQLQQLKQDFRIENLKVTNLTRGFAVLRLEKTSEGNLLAQLRNNYEKTITAYQTSLGSTTTLVEMILDPRDDYIHSGDTTDLIEGLNIDPDLDKKGLTIHAVLFEDGTSDGETKSINELNDYRRGEMAQITQAARQLAVSAESTEDEIGLTLDKVGSTPVFTDDQAGTLSQSFRFGAEDARKRIAVLSVGTREQTDATPKNRMKKILSYCAKKSEQLSLYNKIVQSKPATKVQ